MQTPIGENSMNGEKLRLGVVQMTSARDHAPNISVMKARVEQAAQAGCNLVALPEVAGAMNSRVADMGLGSDETADPFIAACCDAARAHGIWIHTGSTPLAAPDSDKFLNHSNLIDDRGEIVARYDKIHLFDYYPEMASPIVESRRYDAGRSAVLAQTPWGPMGMSVCYDLRFPQLYRDYAKRGARFLMVPSAFTVPTGQAHWHVLLRARAIENGAFVIAAAQSGTHEDGRTTYGHSLVVDPSGQVLLDMQSEPGLGIVDLDLNAVDQARARIPSLTHDREFTLQ